MSIGPLLQAAAEHRVLCGRCEDPAPFGHYRWSRCGEGLDLDRELRRRGVRYDDRGIQFVAPRSDAP